MELIDTHCHLTFDELCEDVDSVIQQSIAQGVVGWITVGTDTQQNIKVAKLVGQYENLYGAAGIHPHYAKGAKPDDIELIRETAANQKIVAIGETGLDFHYNFSKQDAQKNLFAELIEIAIETELPLIVHSRNAFDETIEILDRFKGRLGRVVFHCFGGTESQTRKLLERGFYISFTGIITFKNAEQVRKAVNLVPTEKMMIETDCPYISPEPVRNVRPCVPAMLVHTAKKIAELKGMDLEQFAAAVGRTTKDFFGVF